MQRRSIGSLEYTCLLATLYSLAGDTWVIEPLVRQLAQMALYYEARATA